jgi:membrane protease YdiL (CAAX protease family)
VLGTTEREGLMTTRDPTDQTANGTRVAQRGGFIGFAGRRPLTAFLVLALGIGWPVLAIPAIIDAPGEPFLVLLVYLGLLTPALIVTRLADGPGAIRRLLSRLLIWRFSVLRWAVILFGVPVLTVAISAAFGTLETPKGGWPGVLGTYLFATLVFPALAINLWEETAWAGFFQSRLMARHGLLAGALLTAVPFAAIHIPLQFEGDWTWSSVGVDLAVVFGLALFARYLLGMHLLDTGGSILAAVIQHASWNAAGNLEGVGGDYEHVAATALLTVLVAIGRRLWRPESHPLVPEAEKRAAAEWMGTGHVVAARRGTPSAR